MPLTKTDLKQIKSLIKDSSDNLRTGLRIELRAEMRKIVEENNKTLLDMMFEYFPTRLEVKQDLDDLRSELKLEISTVKDIVVGIRNELDTEHEVRRQQIERNKIEIAAIKRRLDKNSTD